MIAFGQFYLDREKDIAVELTMEGERLFHVIRTPNHHTGNLITNLARLCSLDTQEDKNGLKVIRGEIPCYYDGDNRQMYILRLGSTKIANIYPDGRVELKASIPAISKTLMSQTKDYRLGLEKTIVKTYIRSDCKFQTDLHTHMNGILPPDVLIALGICTRSAILIIISRSWDWNVPARSWRSWRRGAWRPRKTWAISSSPASTGSAASTTTPSSTLPS